MLLPELLILNLVECMQLYYALCLSVIRFIGPSVHLLVHHRDQVENCENVHFRGSHYDCVCASVCGVGEGMNGGRTPLSTMIL